MKAIFVTSVEPYAGKSAVCLALGKKLQVKGFSVGYLKPLSTQPWRMPDGTLADEDAAFVCSELNLAVDPSELSPMIVTASTLRSRLKGAGEDDPLQKILATAERVAADLSGLRRRQPADSNRSGRRGDGDLCLHQHPAAPGCDRHGLQAARPRRQPGHVG